VSVPLTPLVVATSSSTKHSGASGLIVYVVLAVVVVGFLSLRNRRRQRTLGAQPDEIELGSLIVTRAGLIATLVERTEHHVILQLEDGTRARYVPQAVARVWEEPGLDPYDELDETDDDADDPPVSG
jgi:preprotein translocase subunit YajC